MAAGYMTCHSCHLLCHVPAGVDPHDSRLKCPRCAATVHGRIENSLQKTWALLITAFVLYIPANVYPVLVTTSLGRTQADTIMSGVVFLFAHGSWPLGLIVFIASVFVPLAKIIVMVYLVMSVQFRWHTTPVDRTLMYHVTEAIGRWSMVDIYVVTILTALVQLDALATIEAGPAALYFGGVVVVTMLAANAFDPRLIWDQEEANDG